MRSLRPLVPIVLLIAVLLTGCNTTVSVTGSCEVTSNSSTTLDIAWNGAGALTPLAGLKVASHAATRLKTPKSDLDYDRVMVIVDVPNGWTPTSATWTATIGASNESGSTSAGNTEAFCAGSFTPVRPGYVRHYFVINPTALLDEESSGTLQVNYDIGAVATGVYHPLAIAALERDDGCLPGAAFHRVTVNSPLPVTFDVAEHFNADIVVNDGNGSIDTTQTALASVNDVDGAFASASVAAGNEIPGLPDDGIIVPSLTGDLLASLPFATPTPACLPTYQIGFSNTDDGNNAWIPTDTEKSLTFDVPVARYAEVSLLVTGPILDLVSESPSDPLASASIELTYDDDSTAVFDVVLAPSGLPFFAGAELPGIETVAAFTVAIAPMYATDGSGPVESGGGITALLLTPDTTKPLRSITITPIATAPTTRGIETQSSHVPVTMAFWGAAGVAIGEPNLALTKSVTPAGPVFVGQNLTYRLTVTNDGDAAAASVNVVDDLPAQLSFVNATASAGTCNAAAGTVTCSIPSIAAGESETIDIVAQVTAAGSIVNTAEATMSGELDTSDNTATSPAVVAQPASHMTDVPTASTWALLFMTAMLLVVALLRMR